MIALGEALDNPVRLRREDAAANKTVDKTGGRDADEFERIFCSVNGAIDAPPQAPATSTRGIEAALSPAFFPYQAAIPNPAQMNAPASTQEKYGDAATVAAGRVAIQPQTAEPEGLAARDAQMLPPQDRPALSGALADEESLLIARRRTDAAEPVAPRSPSSFDPGGAHKIPMAFERTIRPRDESPQAIKADMPAVPSESMTFHVDDLSVHIPLAIAHSLTDNASLVNSERVAMARDSTHDAVHPRETVKILRFSLEPESLGVVSVRMKIAHSRVEIRLDAQSDVAPALLRAREALSTAIGDKGLILDSCEIRAIAQEPQTVVAADRTPQHTGNFERGFAHDGRSSQQERREGGRNARRPREAASPSCIPPGLVL
ncbi:flagellar hook-length control protein FliK [Methylocystis parvus]|uniref:Flagellar hook-length control protein FliK n=1 Tax=Methylocystis parvus TaxID=134 RepID=A0A6B8M6D8_9HYPH|nr:flagellar hook-length control protein FliK [Methylocystis parvus]QGM97905.1 flagellar hook-length control protein FliK [Methylocystis parvus]WBK01782.1 flagellar hook-length control protein FliK [Methylocystis parvus OBBP]